MEISDADYQRLCELALVTAKPKKERPGVPDKPVITGQIPDGTNELVAWITERLALERIARVDLENRVSVLQFKLDALCNEVREARSSRTDHDSDTTDLPLGCHRKRLQRPLGRPESHEQNLCHP